MKQISIFIGSLLAVLLTGCSGNVKEYHLYYLGGQSNMDGYGYVNDLPAEMNAPVPGVLIFHGNTANDNAEVDGRGSWQILQPGHGVGFRCDDDTTILSNRFGVELSFAHKMNQLAPENNIAIIKYSKGGTSIDSSAGISFGCWYPDYTKGNGVNQLDHFLATVKKAFSYEDIDGDGKKDKLIPSGIIWMQGESDANIEFSVSSYQKNLTDLMDEIRKAFMAPQMPVVIGRISESHLDSDSLVWTFGDRIRQIQADYVASDPNAALVTSTDNYKYSDPWHYDSHGFIDLGEQFALAMYQLETR